MHVEEAYATWHFRPTHNNDDPLAALSAVPEDSCSEECYSKSATDLKIEFKRYMQAAPLPTRDEQCLHWNHQMTEMSILLRLAKKILLIQASKGGESEWHFSCSGMVVNEKKNSTGLWSSRIANGA